MLKLIINYYSEISFEKYSLYKKQELNKKLSLEQLKISIIPLQTFTLSDT